MHHPINAIVFAAIATLGASACVGAGAGSDGEGETMDSNSVRIELDRERCLAGAAARSAAADTPTGGKKVVGQLSRPQPDIAPPGPPINGTAEEPRFAILNRTGEALGALHWKASGTGEWGANRLEGGATLAYGQFCTARVIRSGQSAGEDCSVDMRAVTTGGRAVELAGVDVCSVSRVTFE